VLSHSLLWSKFVNTHLYHSRQWFNLHIHRLSVGVRDRIRYKNALNSSYICALVAKV